MKKLLFGILLVFLYFVPCKSHATIISIAEFDVSALAGPNLFDPLPDNQPGYFTVGIGDFDYFTMFKVYASDVGHTLSYWDAPPILPGVDTGDYFIRVITGYNFPGGGGTEGNWFGSQIPMNYGINYDIGFGIHHDIVTNPRLDNHTINGIYLDVIGSSTDGIPGVSTRLYADVVPEPSTFILLVIGVAGLGLLGKTTRA